MLNDEKLQNESKEWRKRECVCVYVKKNSTPANKLTHGVWVDSKYRLDVCPRANEPKNNTRNPTLLFHSWNKKITTTVITMKTTTKVDWEEKVPFYLPTRQPIGMKKEANNNIRTLKTNMVTYGMWRFQHFFFSHHLFCSFFRSLNSWAFCLLRTLHKCCHTHTQHQHRTFTHKMFRWLSGRNDS